MNTDPLYELLKSKKESSALTRHQEALWSLKHDDWDTAHDLVQDGNDPLSCLIHAYLHKLEGDQWNANYWYRRANSESLQMTTEEEWVFLVKKALEVH